jgi:hypothetical protein
MIGKYNRLRFRLLLFITGVYSAIGITLGGLLYTLWPSHYFSWYPSIPIYYYLIEIIMLVVLEKADRKNPDSVISAYMITRVFKFLITMILLWLYLEFVGEQIKNFGLTLMLFYFIYLIFETYMFYLYEKRRMKKK